MDADVCQVCGLPIAVGDYPCISTSRPHGKSVQTAAFVAYFDYGLGVEVTSMGQRRALMRENKLDYRDKLSPGTLSARRDRIEQQKREESRR